MATSEPSPVKVGRTLGRCLLPGQGGLSSNRGSQGSVASWPKAPCHPRPFTFLRLPVPCPHWLRGRTELVLRGRPPPLSPPPPLLFLPCPFLLPSKAIRRPDASVCPHFLPSPTFKHSLLFWSLFYSSPCPLDPPDPGGSTETTGWVLAQSRGRPGSGEGDSWPGSCSCLSAFPMTT